MKSLVLTMLGDMAQATSAPELYRLHIQFTRRATPAEFLAIHRHPATPARIVREMDGIVPLMFPGEAAAVRCTRREIAGNVNLFVGKDTNRVLVLGFCGRAGLLFLPTAVHTQFLVQTADFAVLADHQQTGFTNGIYAYAPSFDAALERAAGDLDIDCYDEIRTFGTSGGGAAAIAAGIVLGATSMVSFGGRLPTRSSLYGNSPGAATIEQVLRERRPSGRAVAVYAEDNVKDAENARLLCELGDIEDVAISGTNRHNTIHHLLQLGKLGSFYRDVGVLDPVVEPSRTAL